MRKHLRTLLTVALALAAFGGTATVATAKHGADDPVGHVRHSGADDSKTADDSKSSGARKAHRRARHHRADDDRAGHVRHGHGADDGPNHS